MVLNSISTARSLYADASVREDQDDYHKTTNIVLWAPQCYLFSMPRLSIEITAEQHQKLKAIAAIKGQSIKDYVLNKTLGDAPSIDDMSDTDAFAALSDFLEPSIDQAGSGDLSNKSVADIKRDAGK